jgi:hypothetical protein
MVRKKRKKKSDQLFLGEKYSACTVCTEKMAMEDAPPVPQELCNWAQVSTKVNGETHEKVGQSAKRSLAVHG